MVFSTILDVANDSVNIFTRGKISKRVVAEVLFNVVSHLCASAFQVSGDALGLFRWSVHIIFSDYQADQETVVKKVVIDSV